jgi:hypothetical protein
MVGGCAGSGHTSTHHPSQAVAVVRAFVMNGAVASRDCPRLWLPSRQAACNRAIRVIKRARAERALNEIAPSDYRLARVNGRSATVEAGVREPQPGGGPRPFYATFDLVRNGDSWKIGAVHP